MTRISAAFVSLACLLLLGCLPLSRGSDLAVGTDGVPLPLLHRLDSADMRAVEAAMLNALNDSRAAAGRAPLSRDPALGAAAARHARDLALRGVAGHAGADGAAPPDRAARAGYGGRVLGETLAQTYRSGAETLADWLLQPHTRDVLHDPAARDVGIGVWQETEGRLWWVMMVGAGG